MTKEISPSTPTVTVFTRHNADCPKVDDRFWKRCKCRKSIYIYIDGRVTNRSAKTRSWEQAKKIAQIERDNHDLVKVRLREIDAEEARKEALLRATSITVSDAVDRWLLSLPKESQKTDVVRARAAWRVNAWAKDQGIETVREITPDVLDLWRGRWAKDAEKRYNRIGQTSAAQFQGRLKGFFVWCLATRQITFDPSVLLKPITLNKARTQPLTPAQYEELFTKIEPFTEETVNKEYRGYAKELRALFLLQRWAGLRILDCLMLPRTGLVGNRISLITKKTGSKIENRVLPDHVVSALNDLSPDRPTFKPGYFLWNEGVKWENLSTRWINVITAMNARLDFKDEDGQPMNFHSHMLRDTYAVELLKAGVPLEDVSKLLTHTSVTTTERHYVPWVKARLKQLEDKSVAAMRSMGVQVSG
jgi:integrase